MSLRICVKFHGPYGLKIFSEHNCKTSVSFAKIKFQTKFQVCTCSVGKENKNEPCMLNKWPASQRTFRCQHYIVVIIALIVFQMENTEAKDLPKSLQIWLKPLNNEDFNKTSNRYS